MAYRAGGKQVPKQCVILVDKIIELRKRKEWTQQDLAEASGLTQYVIARIESKKSVPTLITLHRIIDVIGVSLTISCKQTSHGKIMKTKYNMCVLHY